MATLHGLLAINAHRTPGKTALVFGDRSHTYAELNALVNRYAHALQSLGVKKGDRVALLSTNSDRFLIAFYGGLKAGAIVSPFNPRSYCQIWCMRAAWLIRQRAAGAHRVCHDLQVRRR